MWKYLFLAALLVSVSLPVSAQINFESEKVALKFRVKLSVEGSEAGLTDAFRIEIKKEIKKISDIELSDNSEYELLIQVMSRPATSEPKDILVSAISTEKTVCILEQDSRGKVVSRRPCREFITSNTYIGQSSEISEVAAEIVTGFDGYVLKPLREID